MSSIWIFAGITLIRLLVPLTALLLLGALYRRYEIRPV